MSQKSKVKNPSLGRSVDDIKKITIRTDVPLEVDWDACRAQVDYARMLALFRDLEFASLIKRIPAAAIEHAAVEPDRQDSGQLAMFEAGHLPPAENTRPPAAGHDQPPKGPSNPGPDGLVCCNDRPLKKKMPSSWAGAP